MKILRSQGINSLKFFFTKDGATVKGTQARERGLKESAQFEWYKVHKILIGKKVILQGEESDIRGDPGFEPWFKTKLGEIRGQDITQKKLLREIAKAVEYKPNSTQEEIYAKLEIKEEELSSAFANIKKDQKQRTSHDFQLKLLSGVIFTNTAYKYMKKKASSKCTFCNTEKQTLIHLYVECIGVNKLRQQLSTKWTGEKMTEKRWFLGVSDTNDILEQNKNLLAKEINHFVFQRNWEGENLSKEAFRNRILAEKETEEALAFEKNTTFDFHVKWQYLEQLLK